MGCGGGSLEASTRPLPEGAEVSPQRYLADSVAVADSIDAFSALLEEVSPVARRGALLTLAPRLDAALDRTTAVFRRIDAERLVDRRLEAQRGRAVTALEPVLAAMSIVSDAARAGDPAAFEDAAVGYATGVGDLRSLPVE